MNQPENTISPFDEMLAYETLWGMHNQSLKSLTSRFSTKDDVLPSQILENWEGLIPDNDLRNKITHYLESNIFSYDRFFSISVNGTFQYPDRLKDAFIRFFYYIGDIGILESKCVSVVGTRKSTEGGARRARKLVTKLVEHGYAIVSGLAAGIDTVAMKTAIEAHGRVVGVIGTPINHYYPPENRHLQDVVAHEHLLMSHVPFYRYDHEPFNMKKLHFPERNITMAALSQATIIVEASDTSGTLTQAKACLEQGRKLFILNSCFEVPGLRWPHTFEKKGAIRVREIDDVLGALNG